MPSRIKRLVAVSWDDDSAPSQSDSSGAAATCAFRRSRSQVWRVYERRDAGTRDAAADWHAFRIAHGVAESGADYALGDAFPHDVLLDQNGGVGFRKGCYVGQEVVSRMQHRGTARRRVLIVDGDGDLPAPGTEIIAGGRAIGTLGSVAGGVGLAIVRIDQVKDAMDAGTPITGRRACRCRSPSRPGRRSPSRRSRPSGERLMADTAGAPPRAWQRMLSGRRLDLLDPSPLDIEIADIAHGLARVARWNGQTQRRPCLFGRAAFAAGRGASSARCSPTRSPDARLAALLHDAPEYVIGDMISPFKSVVGGDYKAVETAAAARHPPALRAAGRRPRGADARRSSTPTRSPPISRRRCSPAFRSPRRRSFFGRPRGISPDRFDLTCKPAKTAQKRFPETLRGHRETPADGRSAKAGGGLSYLRFRRIAGSPGSAMEAAGGGATTSGSFAGGSKPKGRLVATPSAMCSTLSIKFGAAERLGRNPFVHHADDGDIGAIVLDRLVEGDLGLRIERAGGLVEEQQRRLLQQDAGDDQLLLLAARQDLIPDLALAVLVAEMLDEIAEAALCSAAATLASEWSSAASGRQTSCFSVICGSFTSCAA